MKWKINFNETIHGYMECEAETKEEAEEILLSGNGDKFDNKSNLEWEGEIYEDQ